jgi:hypothetical protein
MGAMKRIPLLIISAIFLLVSGCTKPSGNISPTASEGFEVTAEKILEKYKGVQAEYNIDQFAEYSDSDWTYTYHPYLYAAWIVIGEANPAVLDDESIDAGRETYRKIWNELVLQAQEGKTRFDVNALRNLIDDETLRQETTQLIGEGVLAHYAYVRAWASENVTSEEKLNDIFRRLGKLYAENPQLLESSDAKNALSEERDWYEMLIAGTGDRGVDASINLVKKFDTDTDIGDSVDYWDGSVTHVFLLSSIQAARSEAIEKMETLIDAHYSGDAEDSVSDEFIDWALWDLVWTLHSTGGVYPYSNSDRDNLGRFIDNSIDNGSERLKEDIADAIAKAPHPDELSRLFNLLNDSTLDCAVHSIAYRGLAGIFRNPSELWTNSEDDIPYVKSWCLQFMSDQPLECGSENQMDFMGSSIRAFMDIPGGFSSDELVQAHDDLFAIFDKLESADERFEALMIINFDIVTAEDMLNHPELEKYLDRILALHRKWSETTNFENSEVTEDDFQVLLDATELAYAGEYWGN